MCIYGEFLKILNSSYKTLYESPILSRVKREGEKYEIPIPPSEQVAESICSFQRYAAIAKTWHEYTGQCQSCFKMHPDAWTTSPLCAFGEELWMLACFGAASSRNNSLTCVQGLLGRFIYNPNPPYGQVFFTDFQWPVGISCFLKWPVGISRFF